MTFDKNGICELESITTVDECDAYAYFLGREVERHYLGKRDALEWTEWHRQDAFHANPVYHEAVAAFYQSAAKRHQDDLDGIDRLIPKIQAHREALK